jgi:hypothetical protein
MGSVKTDKRQRSNRTEPAVNTSDSNKPPLSIAESSGQSLASATVSSLTDLGEGDPIMVNISYFTTAKILDRRSSPFGVEYRCELEPLWLPAELVKEVPMGGVRVRSYENGRVRAGRLETLRDRKRKHSQM